MSYQVQKIADVGTDNPIVARLTFQFLKIFRWFDLPAPRSTLVLETIMHRVQPRLIECERITLSLTADVNAGVTKGVVVKDGGAIEIPSVSRLRERCEAYLGEARRALREYAGIFRPLLGRDAPLENFAALSKWADKSFGANDRLTVLLRTSNNEWIRRLCDMRDCVEHTDSKKGPLTIADFNCDPTDPAKIVLHQPFWSLEGMPGTPIAADLREFDRKLLLFFEETLLAALQHVRAHVPVTFVEIPEAKRDPGAAERFQAVTSVGGVAAPAAMTRDGDIVPELQRMLQQGHGRPIIATRFHNEWFVATHSTVYHSPSWKTFHDFLFFYIKKILGGGWPAGELAKPRAERHPLLNWVEDVGGYMKAAVKTPGAQSGAPMTSLCAAYLGLAYNLYLISHNNGKIHDLLIHRLKNRENFFGAYYETVAAGIMIKAGFDLELEDEADSSTSHCEFTATHRASNQKFSVEAKYKETASDDPSVRRQLYRALKKRALHDRIVFIEVNSPTDGTIDGLSAVMKSVLAKIRAVEPILTMPNGDPAPPAYLVITNDPPGTVHTVHRPATMLEGFKIPDFRMENTHSRLRHALAARKRQPAMYALYESIKVHTRIPSTFDGELPSFAFGPRTGRLVIGQLYKFNTPEGDVEGQLVDAHVLLSEKTAICTIMTASGKPEFVTSELSEQEMTAYHESPRTFFGAAQPEPGPMTDGLKIFDWLCEAHRGTSKEQMLTILAKHPEPEKLKTMTREELVEIYAEFATESIFRDAAFQKAVAIRPIDGTSAAPG